MSNAYFESYEYGKSHGLFQIQNVTLGSQFMLTLWPLQRGESRWNETWRNLFTPPVGQNPKAKVLRSNSELSWNWGPFQATTWLVDRGKKANRVKGGVECLILWECSKIGPSFTKCYRLNLELGLLQLLVDLLQRELHLRHLAVDGCQAALGAELFAPLLLLFNGLFHKRQLFLQLLLGCRQEEQKWKLGDEMHYSIRFSFLVPEQMQEKNKVPCFSWTRRTSLEDSSLFRFSIMKTIVFIRLSRCTFSSWFKCGVSKLFCTSFSQANLTVYEFGWIKLS